MKNPYVYKNNLLFYGRELIMRDLLKDEQAGKSVVLIGGRRCGKTSLLRRISQILTELALSKIPVETIWMKAIPDANGEIPKFSVPVHWPISVNFMGIDGADYGSVLKHIAQSVQVGLAPLGDDFPRLQENPFSNSTLQRFLIDVDSWLNKKALGGIALLLDEIEETFNLDGHHDLMSFLRLLDDETLRGRIWILIVGADALDQYYSPRDGSPPLNTTRRNRLADLGYVARRRMAIEPFTNLGYLPPEDTLLTQLDQSAGGNVWLLTLILEQIFEFQKVSQDFLINEIVPEIMDGNLGIFQRWARPINENGWKLYERIVTQGSIDRNYCRTDFQKQQRFILEYQGLVHRRISDGKIELGPDLFRDWAESNGYIENTDATASRKPQRSSENEVPAPGAYRYDVAISYASPQKEIARDLADKLNQQKLKVFYDRQLGHELWGVDLGRHLPETYDRESRIAVLLISADYITRHWTQVEKQAAFSGAIRRGCD